MIPERVAQQAPVFVSAVLPMREYLLTGLTAAVVTFLLTGPVRVLAVRLGAVAWPRGRDVHSTPTPRWGGLAMLGGVLAGVLLALPAPGPAAGVRLLRRGRRRAGGRGACSAWSGCSTTGSSSTRSPSWSAERRAARARRGAVGGVLDPVGGGGTGISGSFLILGQTQGVLLTVVLTVAMINAMNFVDGLDGLAAGIGLIAAAATALFAIGLVKATATTRAPTPRRCSRWCWPAHAWGSCRTTSTRPGSSWATPARCSSG